MSASWLSTFCAWLEQTPISQTIQSVSWIVPTVQTIHILAIAGLIGSALMIALRALGRFGMEQTQAQVAARFLPVIWWALLVLLATGVVMVTGEPARSLANWGFQLKMAMLVAALLATRTLQVRLAETSREGAVTAVACIGLALWAGIILAGRWIAYI